MQGAAEQAVNPGAKTVALAARGTSEPTVAAGVRQPPRRRRRKPRLARPNRADPGLRAERRRLRPPGRLIALRRRRVARRSRAVSSPRRYAQARQLGEN